MSNNETKTVSDHRAEKARMTGDQAAWVIDQKEIRFRNKCREYLQANPDVGELNRAGKKVFYRYNEAYEEFTPESVIEA